MNNFILGIDPGKHGAATFITEEGELIDIIKFSKVTEHEIADAMLELLSQIKFAYIENVTFRPGMAGRFVFGDNFGFWRGILTALKIPYEKVAPGTWQRSLKCLTKGDKNITKTRAQQLFPKQKITHEIADSILIAEYGRRLNMR